MTRFVVPGVPPGAQPSAFAPHLNRLAGSGAQMYKGAVEGQPGTLGIPAPTKDTAPSPDLGDLAMGGYHRSSDAPDVWYPNQYYERSLDGDGTQGPITPVRVYSDNLMPVPAVDPRGTPATLSVPVIIRGQRQIVQPAAQPRWS